MNKRSLIWKIPLALLGVVSGLALLLLIVVAVVLYVPSVRSTLLEKGVEMANEQTDLDIDLERIYLSPFHHSPMVLYRAYKGQADLPLEVEIDSLFVGHRGQDTLIYVHALRLRAKAKTSQFTNDQLPITHIPIEIDTLRLESTTFHSDSLIPPVGVNVVTKLLALSSPQIVLAKGQYPLRGLRLDDAFIGIDLRDTPPDTTAQDTTPLLMAYEAPDALMHNVHFRLTPLGMDIHAGSLSTNVLADVGGAVYDARRLDIGDASLSLGSLFLPFDTLYGNALVDLAHSLITSQGLHARSAAFGAQADLQTTALDLETMRVDVIGDADYQGSQARLRGFYDIDDEAYDMRVDVQRVNLSPFLKDSTHVLVAGTLHAQGKGIDPSSRAMKSQLHMHLTDAEYSNIIVSGITLDAQLANKTVDGTLHLPVKMQSESMPLKARTEHQFRVSDFMTPKQMAVDYHAQIYQLHTKVADNIIQTDEVQLNFATDTATSLDMTTRGLNLTASSPMHVLTLVDQIQPLLNTVSDSVVIKSLTSLTDLTLLDTIRRLVPEMDLAIEMAHGSPAQPIIDHMGLDIRKVQLSLNSDARQTDLALSASIPNIDHPEDSTALRLPPADAALKVSMIEGLTNASLTARSHLTDGAMSFRDLCTDAALRLDVTRSGNELHGDGRLTLDSVLYGNAALGDHAIDMQIAPSQEYAHAIRADIQTEDIPVDLADAFVQLTDIGLHGAVRASASVDGLPNKTDISAQVEPHGVQVEYEPYEVVIGLGETPITMIHNHIDFNGLPLYGADSTYLALTGGLDLDSMRLDIALAADSFAPVKLVKDGSLPVYGELATDIRGRVTGPLDSIIADVDLTLLPVTDITYPIDKKNLAQVKPYGTINVRYQTAEKEPLSLGGQINVDDGVIKYSPKMYPVMPFHIDSGSHVAFHGPIGQTQLNISASQQVKADVESEGDETRRVDFTTGVRVKGEVDSIGMKSIGFFLEAPNDEVITRELMTLDEETRAGLAATLLATGMYVGESNVAAQRGGYALSSIINSRINAALANSKMGKVVDIDFSSAQTEHAGGKTNDMNISISKSFFKDKLRITLGSTLTDNPEINDTKGLFNSFSADYKLTKDGSVSLRLFSQRDYNNILEGELYKYGLGVRAMKDWHRKERFRTDSIIRTYGLTADAGIAYRSNNSIGPDLTIKSSIKNLLGKNEMFTLKGNGAYYWALRNRHPGDPKKTDTYKLGLNASLIFPYLHWVGDNNPAGDTRYMLGYQYENIAGGYGVHKLSGSFTYFIRSANNPHVTHAFTPFSLSMMAVKAESADLYNKAAEYPQLIKVIASDEFVPSISYNFYYDDYRDKRAVNTYLNLGVKESGNLLNAMYCLAGYKWSDMDKPLGKAGTFNQFVKMHTELRNKFNITDKISIATRLFAGANLPTGNSLFAPLSEAFYTGGPNSLRAATPYAYGPGNFYSLKYNQNFFHAGDVKLEANFEFRFPIVWKLFGAAFVDAGNVWNWLSTVDIFKAAGYEDYLERMQIPETLHDGVFNNPEFAKQIALGTGFGLRLDIDGLVVRLDLGYAIHAPYQTFRYNKDWTVNYDAPIKTYYNMPSALDALRLNFGIGYPF